MSEFKDIFGAPNTGVHKYRMFGLAAVDLIGTVVIAYAINGFVINYALLFIFIILMILSVIIHKAFGVETALVKKIN
jgi:hypothetical protein